LSLLRLRALLRLLSEEIESSLIRIRRGDDLGRDRAFNERDLIATRDDVREVIATTFEF
jgi:hypothetical protein